MGVHLAQALEPGNVDLRVGIAATQLSGHRVPFLVGEGHPCGLAAGQLVKRRHSGIYIALLDQRPHEAEEEGQQQRPDMGAVHIGIRHDDDFMIAQLGVVKFVTDTRSQRRDHRLELIVAIHLVRPGLFHVQHLAP